VAGALIIWFINCLRVSLLLIALKHDIDINGFTNHHTLYNIAAYLIIGVMIYLFSEQSKQELLALRPKTNETMSNRYWKNGSCYFVNS
jgi:hypothetical protein